VGQPVRLCIFAADPDRARAFYAKVFGWSLPEDGGGWVMTSVDDPRLGIDDSDTAETGPVEPYVPTVHITDLDATTAAALAAGGEVLVPRIPLPRAGWLVYLTDTEGNLIGIMQDDPDAAWPTAPGRQRGVPRSEPFIRSR
jgi:predicted enzyme related to lactoylglutathione lyase